MAVVGDAYIVVRAISNRVREDIQKELNGIGGVGEKAGRDLGNGLRRGINKGSGGGLKVITPQLRKEAEEARLLFRTLARAQLFLVPAITGVLGAIGSLGSGLLVLVGVLGNAAKGSIVFISALGGLAQAATTAKLAFSGVGNAISAGLKAQENSISNTRALEAAERRLRDARLDLKRLIEEEKPERLAEARERAVRAEEAAADALLNSERATRTYNQAQKRTLDSLEDLNDAREEAKESLQQLRFELEGGAISEKKARLEFEKARDSLQRVQDLPPNSRARQEAELAFAEAELNLRKAIDNNKDLKIAEQEATRAGVEGSDRVVDAKEAILTAQQAETDAGIAAAKAIRDASRAQVDAQEAAAAAASGGSVERDIDRQIASAREQVKLAEQALGDAASSGIDAYAQALAKLSPEQRNFVDFMVNSFIPALDSLKAAAARELLPALETALTIIQSRFRELEPLIQATGGVLGRLATDFANTFFEGENFERLKRVWEDNNGLLEDLGTTVINLAEGVLILLDNARPLVTAFGDWATSTSEAWKNTLLLKDGNGQLAEEFETLRDRISRITGIFGNYKEAFGTIFDVINQPGGAGDQLIGYFEEASQSFLDFIKAGQADGSLDEFFKSSTDNFTKILDILGSIAGDLLNLGASEGLGQLLDGVQAAVDIFGEVGESISGPDGALAGLGTFIEEFARLFQLTTENETFQGFFLAVNNALQSINAILQNETVQAIFKAVAPIAGFLIGFGLVQQTVRFVGKTIFGVLLSAFSPLAAVVPTIARILGSMGAFGKVLLTVFGFLGRVFGFLIKFAGPIGFIISLLLTVVPIIIKNWDSIVAFFKGVFERISAFIQPFVDGVVNFFSGLFERVKEFLEPFFEFFVGYFTVAFDIIRGIIEVFVAIWKIAFVLIATVVQAVWDGIKAGFKAVSDFLKPILDKIFGFFGDIFGKVGDFVGGIWDGITEGFQAFLDFIEPGISSIFGFFETVFNNVKSFFKDVMNVLIGFAEGFVNFFIDGLNAVIDKINGVRIPIPEIARGVFGGASELGFNIRKVGRVSLPRLADGGIVQATAGGVLSVIGEAGKNERVEPLDPTGLSKRDRAIIDRLSGGRGTTINVYPSAGMDEKDLADLVSRRLAFELRRGAA